MHPFLLERLVKYMAYIAPNSVIKILKNVPLDNTYDHTIYFENKTSQKTYFDSLVKYTLQAQSYQRINKDTMRVQILADNLYDCNYIMFQNTSFGDKWFYAFITKVEYVNNITSEITFEIDVMQTWHFDYTLGECFVEREHTETDVVGQHVLPEPIDIGDIVCHETSNSGLFDSYHVVVAYADTNSGQHGGGGVIEN